MKADALPVILVVDDLFGRTLVGRRNEDRANLCGKLLLLDITGDEEGKGEPQRILRPSAYAVFCRGQVPSCASVGDIVRNDLEVVLKVLRAGPPPCFNGPAGWLFVLVDLCFRTGPVTVQSNANAEGMPEGRPGDDDPERFFGIEIAEASRAAHPSLPVVVLSSQTLRGTARALVDAKADGFIERDSEDGFSALLNRLEAYGRRR